MFKKGTKLENYHSQMCEMFIRIVANYDRMNW